MHSPVRLSARPPVRLLRAAFALATIPASLAAQEPARSAEWQIATAVLPLPDSMRPGARVLGYRGAELVELRAGRNGMTCLADDPKQKEFQASCYHNSLEPFMARGRALRARGVTDRKAIDSIRLRDVQTRRYAIPRGAILASVYSKEESFDPAAGGPPGQTGLDVIYLPYATQANTGIAEIPLEDRPWIMFPGKPWAHVMLSR